MYCGACNTHFSESVQGGLCPVCGKSGGPTPPGGGVALEPPPGPAHAHDPIQSAGSRAAAPLIADRGPSPPSARAAEPAGRPATPANRAGNEQVTRTERLPPDPWAPGSRVAGKYEVISQLGSGGFGTVYKVRHVFRKKYYALKTPHPQFLREEIFRRRFEREIEAMERFVHPDAVMIRDCGVTESGLPYYTMDFIDGESLKAILLRERRLPAERALRITRRVLRVLEAAHGSRIIHRDVKPDNILLTHGGGREQVKVLDFGVAKLLDLVGWTSITQGGRVGTPRYMSPEQITGEPVDERSDLFSLGIILYEMVTGQHPFARDRDPIRVTADILNRSAVPPRELAPDLPRQVSERILWMLEKKPRRRPASAQAVLEALPEGEEERCARAGGRALEVYPGAPRSAVQGLVLRQALPQGERRIFLLFKERVTFGRSGEGPGGGNDLVLRCLPCRSPELDPESWRRNLTLSQRLGSAYPEGSALVIEPDPRAPGGIAINGVRSQRPARIQSDRFHLSLGERALEIDGYRRVRRADVEGLDLSAVCRGRPAGVLPPAAIGYGQPACAIDHVQLRRASNHPLHEYFLVFRQLPLGSAAHSGLCLQGTEEEHALLIFEGGEVFLFSMEGEVLVARPAPGGAGEPAGEREEVALPPDVLYPVVPGIEILLGPARVHIESMAPDWFKRV